MADFKDELSNNDEKNSPHIKIDINKIIEQSDDLNKAMRADDDYEHPPVYEYDEKSPDGERRIFDYTETNENCAGPKNGADKSEGKQDKPAEQTKPDIPSKKKKVGFAERFIPLKGDSSSEVIRKIALLVSVLTMIICIIVIIGKYAVEPVVEKIRNNNISQLKTDDDNTDVFASYPDIDFPQGMSPGFAELYAQNSDFAGWLEISGLDIKSAVVRADDNEKYLKKNFYGESSKYGCPFIDYRNGLLVMGRNTIIYGHNMVTDDLIFGKLEEYKTVDGFKSAPVIEFDTLYNDYKWKVYAVFITNADEEDDNGYVFRYNFTNVSSDEVFSQYIEQIDQRKLYTTGVDIKPSDKILTLSTCSYEFNNARIVVVARMVRNGEPPYVDTSNAQKNASPRYPQVWYDIYNNGNNPYRSSEKWTPG